jgi:hypothetical protein
MYKQVQCSFSYLKFFLLRHDGVCSTALASSDNYCSYHAGINARAVSSLVLRGVSGVLIAENVNFFNQVLSYGGQGTQNHYYSILT